MQPDDGNVEAMTSKRLPDVTADVTASVRVLLDSANKAAWKLDAAPVSPAGLAARWARRNMRARKAIAMTDPDFAAQENARKLPQGSVVVSRPGTGLTVEAFTRHRERLQALAPRGWQDTAARSLARVRAGQVTAVALSMFDKATRGWDDADIWNLDSSMASRTGAQLHALADLAHGWPDCHYETYDEWVAALREHGTALADYANQAGVDEATAEWHLLPAGPEREDALTAVRLLEDSLAAGATRAWEWIAVHHAHLWD